MMQNTLSLQRTDIPPRFWMESKRLTIAFFLESLKAPRARFVLTMAGSISGTRPTATLTLNKAALPQFLDTFPEITRTYTQSSGMISTSKVNVVGGMYSQVQPL